MKQSLLWISLFIMLISQQVSGQASYWSDEDNYDTSWYKEEQEIFTIDTPEELAGIYKLSEQGELFEGKEIRLTSDIDLGKHQWNPIPNFNGTLSCNEHVLNNLLIKDVSPNFGDSYKIGIFANLESHATIKDLTISQNCNIQLNTDNPKGYSALYVGFIAGYASDAQIRNCHNKGNITIQTKAYSIKAGGIAGTIQLDRDNSHLINCSNTGKISSTAISPAYHTIGGIVGEGLVGIENCRNSGSIFARTSEGSSHLQIGGIAGESGGFTNCTNSGYISGENPGGYIEVGGICGYNNSDWISKNCSNTGTIQGTANVCMAGGIMGSTTNVTIILSTNAGAVTATAKTAEANGISSANFDALYINCGNTGSVISAASYSSTSSGIGAAKKIVNCYNHGTTSASTSIADNQSSYSLSSTSGGISARSSEIYNCYNSAVISADINAKNVEVRSLLSGPISGVDNSTLNNAYYNKSISYISTNQCGTALTESEMRKESFSTLLNNNSQSYNNTVGKDSHQAHSWISPEPGSLPIISEPFTTGIYPISPDKTMKVYSNDGKLYIKSSQKQTIPVYSYSGNLVQLLYVNQGIYPYELPAGIYILAGQKVIIESY